MTSGVEQEVAPAGARLRLAWRQMPVMAGLRWRLRPERPLKGARVGVALHVSAETAHLIVTLKDAGAAVLVHPSNPNTRDMDALGELARHRTVRLADVDGEDTALRYALHEFQPTLLIDNGALLAVCRADASVAPGLLGATVHSQSAEAAVRAMVDGGWSPPVPVLSIADSILKSSIETPMGCGQSSVTAVVRATGMQLSGKQAVVIGYGKAGAGIAAYLSAMRARVTVVDTSPLAALRAVMAGHCVDTLENALSAAELVISATGSRRVITGPHFRLMPDGAVVANIGHYRDAIDVQALRDMAERRAQVSPCVMEYRLPGRTLLLLGDGSQFNHVCGDGNASELMDLTLSLHVHCLLHLHARRPGLEPGLRSVPLEMNEAVAEAKLRALGYTA